MLIGILDDSFDEARCGLALCSEFEGVFRIFVAGDARCDEALWFDSHRPFDVGCMDVFDVFGVLIRWADVERSSGVVAVLCSLNDDSYGLKLDFC